MKKYTYDTSKYKFKELIENHFNVNNLARLHDERRDLLPKEQLNFFTETKTKFHQHFYSKLREGWNEIELAYENFIKNEITPMLNFKFIYQSFPSIRFHIPNDQAIHYWHYDSDKDHMHPEWEINFQIALTDMYDTQATWIESVPGLGDFSPMEMTYGDYYAFDGNKCIHGNKVNISGSTRVSFDFRIIPYDRYATTEVFSATKGKKFVIGDYYKEVK